MNTYQQQTSVSPVSVGGPPVVKLFPYSVILEDSPKDSQSVSAICEGMAIF